MGSFSRIFHYNELSDQKHPFNGWVQMCLRFIFRIVLSHPHKIIRSPSPDRPFFVFWKRKILHSSHPRFSWTLRLSVNFFFLPDSPELPTFMRGKVIGNQLFSGDCLSSKVVPCYHCMFPLMPYDLEILGRSCCLVYITTLSTCEN